MGQADIQINQFYCEKTDGRANNYSIVATEMDDIEFPGDIPMLEILPYQFEPLRARNIDKEEENSSSNNSESETDDQDQDSLTDRLLNTHWCDCGNCEIMSTAEECICCTSISAVNHNMIPDDLQCITESQIFIDNCLNRNILYVSMFEHLQQVGPFDDNEPINERYRYMAYRRFVLWIWQWLGKKNRKVLPACVVQKIRDAFPSEEYCGFKYADV